MLRTLFCLLAVCTGCITLHAQKLTDFISYDTLTYVYVLDSTQTRFVFTHPDLPDTSFLFNTKPLTFSSRTYRDDSLGNGNFLVTTILQDRIYYRFVHHASFVLKTRCIGEDLIFYLSDTKTKALLTKASLQLNNQPVPFDDGYGGYAVSRKLFLKKKQTEFGATLCIVSGNEFQLERIQTSSTMPSVPEPRRYPAGTVLLSNG